MILRSVVAMSLLVAVSSCSELSNDPLDQTQACFDYWKNTLKDPFSAKIIDSVYGQEPLSPTSERLEDVLTVEYRAKNSYGAYGPGYFECTLKDGKIDELSSRIRAAINEE